MITATEYYKSLCEFNCKIERSEITTYDIAYSLRDDYPDMSVEQVNKISEEVYQIIIKE